MIKNSHRATSRVHPPIVGNLDITGKLWIAQLFMIAHWKGIVVVIILSIKRQCGIVLKRDMSNSKSQIIQILYVRGCQNRQYTWEKW